MLSRRALRRGAVALIAAIGAAGLVATGPRVLGHGDRAAAGAPAEEPTDVAEAHADAVTYQCPMHPDQISDRPGRCPICGMRLVAQEDTSAPADSADEVEGLVGDEEAPEVDAAESERTPATPPPGTYAPRTSWRDRCHGRTAPPHGGRDRSERRWGPSRRLPASVPPTEVPSLREDDDDDDDDDREHHRGHHRRCKDDD